MIAVPERVKIVMAMLERAANDGVECPGNAQIAVAIGAASMSAGANIIATLEAMNLIQVARGRSSRVVTILASGRRTRGVVNIPIKPKQKRPKQIWNDARDATLMEAMAQGLDFEQAAHWIGLDAELCAARFDELASVYGAQAA